MRGINKYGWGYILVQDNPKNSRSNNKKKVKAEENTSVEDKKVISKENSSYEEKSEDNLKKAAKSITKEILLQAKEEEKLGSSAVEVVTKPKSKGAAKRTTARKNSAAKPKQQAELKAQNGKYNEIEKIIPKEVEKETPDSKAAIVKTTADIKKSSPKSDVKNKRTVSKKVEEKAKEGQIKNTVKKAGEKLDKTEVSNHNIYLFHQGKNYEVYNMMGAHIRTEKRKKGVQFATWAPNAADVYVVGDFNNFEVNDEYKLEKISENGLWKGFFTEPKAGDKYKYCIIEKNGERGEYKADPYGVKTELRPNNASIVCAPKDFNWNDQKWIEKRNKVNVLEQPLNIYEIHLGSWKTNKDGGFLSYEEIAGILPKYVKEMGYTHVEIMPLVEHPLDASWGYQGTGYYSPTSRYGSIEGLKTLVNKLHEANIGVVMDWVPGHFCKDAHGLYKFDGTPTYEYQEEWRAENKGWGTCNFDLGRPEVKSYLISNALYWYREFHIDGLRVDAVSSILYLDYNRSEGEWVPNKYGDKGNLEAIEFLKELNQAVFAEYPTALMIAEESTAWPNVTKPPVHEGLGFNLKWNMGWMNDTLEYVEIDPRYRSNNHKNITFAMMYNYAENYLLPLSHDEVVHGKKSLVDKMWGDEWNKFAGLRSFMGYMIGHPGKKLVFMGCEFGQRIEWREYSQLEWDLIDDLEIHKQTHLFFKDLNNIYLNNKAFWELDHDCRGFNWIEADNSEQSVLIFARRSRNDKDTLIFIINFTSAVYYDYRIGVPFLGSYKELFNTDASKYGGSGQVMDGELVAEKTQFHNQPYSLKIKVPPMATLVLKVDKIELAEGALEKEVQESN
jgi:1,4-alpha-glucan branching enzyme